jgi:hypothetical protein
LEFLIILFFFGLSAAVIGKIKGSSFLLWFLIGFCVPLFGTIAAVLYRFERAEPRRQCPDCGRVVKLHEQVCMTCGGDLEFPDEPAPAAAPARAVE